MPELPEVETVRSGLEKLIIDKKIIGATHDWPKSFPNTDEDVEQFLIGANITAIKRRAKVLILELSSDYSLVIHLKMTGQLVFLKKNKNEVDGSRYLVDGKLQKTDSPTTNYEIPTTTDEVRFGAGHPNESLIGNLPDKSTRVIFTFDDNSKLYFNDQRKFGWVRLLPTVEVPNIDFMKKVGPEPLADDFTPRQFIERVRRRSNTNIKAVLLDQTVVAGIGNIYADEGLWGAKIHPTTTVKDVSDKELNTLFTHLQAVLRLSIEKGGSSDKNYVNAEGKRGSYLTFAEVFRREGKPCSRCGSIIEKSRVAGRGTHTCPKCQRLKK